MKWNHLPEAGGLYDQDPELLERFAVIFDAQGREQARKQAEQDAKQNNPRARPRTAGRRGR